MRAKVPIRVKNVMNPRGIGTLVWPNDSLGDPGSIKGIGKPFDHVEEASSVSKAQRTKAPTAITSKHKVVVINVFSEERSFRPSFFANVIEILHQWQLSINLVCTSQVQMSVAIQSEVLVMAAKGDENFDVVSPDLLGAIEHLRQVGSVKVILRMAIISVVG